MQAQINENFVVYRPKMSALDTLSKAYETLDSLMDKNNSDSNLAAQKLTAQIKLHYAKANELYFTLQYQEALNEYKTTQALIYKLMNPSFNLGVELYPGFELPVTVKTFESTLKSCLKILDVMVKPVSENLFGLDEESIPDEIVNPIAPYVTLGIQTDNNIAPEVIHDTEMGLDYANLQQWDKAEHLFTRALTKLEGAQSNEKKAAKASIQLNLSNVLIQNEKIDQAKTMINKAIKGFKSVGDNISVPLEKTNLEYNKQVNYLSGNSVVSLKWQEGKEIDINDAKSVYYANRITENRFDRIRPNFELDTDVVLNLPHMYSFTLPVCIGDCYHHLGEFQKAFNQYKKASSYQYINQAYEIPSLWMKIAKNYLEWGDFYYKDYNPEEAITQYTKVITIKDTVPNDSFLYKGVMDNYGNKVGSLITDIDNAEKSTLNPNIITMILEIRTHLTKIAAGLDFTGFPAEYFPIFKFDYLQSITKYFANQAVQAEREYIGFYSKGEDDALTKLQLQQSLEVSSAEIELSQKQLEYAEAEFQVTKENIELLDERIQNAKDAKNKYSAIAYDLAQLSAANAFAAGPEGYEVSYSYYSQKEGKNVTVSGSDAYKVMKDIALKKGMLSREMELLNMQNNIDEMEKAKDVAKAQKESAGARVDVAKEQKKIAKMRKKHAQSLLDAFDNQVFTPEVWFQLGYHMYNISRSYLYYAINFAKKMESAYELENGIKVQIIKNEYDTNIVSGLLSADYLLKDIDYFDVHYIGTVKSKDIPAKKTYSISQLNPMAFETTFKETGKIDFNTPLEYFDRAFPGSYLRKIKRVEVAVEGMVPTGGVTGVLKNSGFALDRKKNGTTYYRVQPYETLFTSEYHIKQDAFIFQGNKKVLDVFENTGVSTNWSFELSPSVNNVDFNLISDIKVTLYYSARHDRLLENKVKEQLPDTGEKSMVVPFQLLFPDEYYSFLDSAELPFSLTDSDFAYNETNLKIKNLSIQIVTDDSVSSKGITVELKNLDLNVAAVAKTDDSGIVKTDPTIAAITYNTFLDKNLSGKWKIAINETETFKAKSINRLFLFVEYGFKYRGV
nr:hypothetical protein [uncultured Desulfobacter sp.]